jgi:hypothetical protein
MTTLLVSLTDAAEMLGTDPRTISGLVEVLGIKTKRMPLPGRYRGLDASDIKALRKAIESGRKAVASTA